MAWANQAGESDYVCDHYEYRRLPPFSAFDWGHGRFSHSLPIVMTCSLIASRLVSMTFIPLIGYYLLRPYAG
jgi:multidrug efflux pump subunit AcrB